MYIPVHFSPILFSGLLSAIMVCIASAFVLAISQRIYTGFVGQSFTLTPRERLYMSV